MAVDPTQRSHGVGNAILQELEARALAFGIQEINLNSRQEAVPFYRKTGIRFYDLRTPSLARSRTSKCGEAIARVEAPRQAINLRYASIGFQPLFRLYGP